MNTVFRPVNPVLDRNMFIFKVTVFINRAKYEYFVLRSAYSTCRANTRYVKRSTGHTHTHTTAEAEHTTAEQTTHTNTHCQTTSLVTS